ncbi:hypothetical protein IDM40_06815 [Nocardiopsis sp. HNM0947]|uniref:histidine kinase n=1 Tax=Nocardiopsis coralli TaxID=2772213 RepID=A0ABR9P3I8_9ACTN|nr:histidine kinase [Nocardiopsis coralli]MBE2998418.1 hypothetical protein [Nocardiopsis coralli]
MQQSRGVEREPFTRPAGNTAPVVLSVLVFGAIVATGAGAPVTHMFATPMRLSSPAEIALTLTVATLSAAAVAAARITPWPLFAAAAVGWLAFASWPALFAASFVAATRLRRRAHLVVYVVLAVLLVEAPALVRSVLQPLPEWQELAEDLLGALPMTVVVPVLVGLWVNARQATTDALRERAEHAQREQEAREDQARAEERARIAREMHDVVAHHISLIVLQTTAAQVTTGTVSTEQLARIRGAARGALAELREVLGVLRNSGDEAERAPQPFLTDLDRLVEQSRAAGVPVDLAADRGLDRLAPLVQRAAYRTVQEGLTNVRKHAGGAAAEVELRLHGDELMVHVRNGAPASQPVEGSTGSNQGLAGLRQRAEILGGRLHADHSADGGFVLVAHLPARTGEDAAGAADPATSSEDAQ